MARLVFFLFGLLCAFSCAAQVANAPAARPAAPLPVQLKKAIVFLETACLLKVTPQDEINVSPEALGKLTEEQQRNLRQTLSIRAIEIAKATNRLNKLSPLEANELLIPSVNLLPLPELMRLLGKLLDLNSKEISSLKMEEIDKLPAAKFMGTAFFASVQDNRTPKGQSFAYLVTNRHVVQPGVEDGKACVVLNDSIWLNKNGAGPTDPVTLEISRLGSAVDWTFSDDASVDLAVVPASPDGYDALTIPEDMFVSDEMVANNDVLEGDPVLFTGLFVQTLVVHRLEPIVRSGIVAMLPNGPIETTLKKPGKVYLTEAHAYHGNSGSPVLVDVSRFKNQLVSNFKVLGVLSGEVFESADFTLQVAMTAQGTTGANSDVSVVVPASALKDILHSAKLQKIRDQVIAATPIK